MTTHNATDCAHNATDRSYDYYSFGESEKEKLERERRAQARRNAAYAVQTRQDALIRLKTRLARQNVLYRILDGLMANELLTIFALYMALLAYACLKQALNA